jgi:hypothetical protein
MSSTLDPTAFSTLLSNSTPLFPFSSSTQFPMEDTETFPTLIQNLAGKLRVSVVEVVESALAAASLYATSLKGVHVAGLIKLRKKPKGKGGVVSLEFRSGDKVLIDGLVEEANEFMLGL